jgi:hypothetical protein
MFLEKIHPMRGILVKMEVVKPQKSASVKRAGHRDPQRK